MKFSLLFPNDSKRKFAVLTDEAVNDLSLEFILDALTEERAERPHLLSIMKRIPSEPETIRYHRDIFDDFLRFPKLREAMSDLVKRLSDLPDSDCRNKRLKQNGEIRQEIK